MADNLYGYHGKPFNADEPDAAYVLRIVTDEDGYIRDIYAVDWPMREGEEPVVKLMSDSWLGSRVSRDWWVIAPSDDFLWAEGM